MYKMNQFLYFPRINAEKFSAGACFIALVDVYCTKQLKDFNMRFRCPFCYYTISVDDMSRGYPVICAGCGKEVLIPPGRFDPGCIIGDFVILEKLGAGSIGTVYKATQLSLDRQVALKILSPEYMTSKGVEDFLREARAAAKLTHTNLVQSYAVGEDDGFCYMAMTYVNGENLRTRLRREGRIPVDEALHIAQQVAEALYYAWDEAGLIHRDVKPDNIMITDDGIVKLTDLGLAMNQSEWHEGMDVSGSPSYMSPEQFRGEKLDPRSDVYSLGVTLYQMISGRLPFESDSVKKLAEMHLEKEPPSLRRLVPGVPLAVDALVRKMMAKRREDRFASMEEVLKAIWTIRQKTAPNKSLVPDVHTISIKRLDYDMQTESSELKAKAAEKVTIHASLMDRVITGFVAAAGTLVITLILVAVFMPRKGGIDTFDKVSYFEKLSGDRSLDSAAVLEEGRKILDELPNRGTVEYEYNLAKMKNLLSAIELETLRSENLQFKQENSGLKRKNRTLSRERDNLSRRNTQLERVVAANSDYSEIKQKLADQNAAAQALGKSLADQQARNSALKKELDTAKQAALEHEQLRIRLVLLRYQLNREFREGEEFLLNQKEEFPALAGWLSKKLERNRFFGRIYELVSESGDHFIGCTIKTEENEYTVLDISDGVIRCQNRIGGTELKDWNTFLPEALTALLMNDSEMKKRPRELAAGCELLQERLGPACAADPEDAELQAVASAYAQTKKKQLTYALSAGSAKARQQLREFLQSMEGARIYPELKQEFQSLAE